jgi:SAM-dependent methyltransferase
MIVSWSSGTPGAHMDDDILLCLRDVIARHPWWLARRELVLALLRELGIRPPSAVLEAGCGWGVNLEGLEAAGYQVTGLDISRKMLDRLDRDTRCLVEADLSHVLPNSLPCYDSVLALDVIEHIDDDHHATRQLARLLNPTGRLIVSVPALPELFSEFDEIQGHRRRYSAQALRNCIESAGLVVNSIRWWGQWMVLPLLSRKAKRHSRPDKSNADVYRRYLELPPWPGPLAMNIMFRIDHWRTLRCRNVTGTSLIAIAERPSQGSYPTAS